MTYLLVLFLYAAALRGGDDRHLSLALRAQLDFDRVEQAAAPDLAMAAACVQSQAAFLSVAAPRELSLIHYRRGRCELAGALVAWGRRGFDDAARSFERAIAAWPARLKDKKTPLEPLSAGLAALPAIARLNAGADLAEWPELDRQLGEAKRGACSGEVMQAALCLQLLDVAGAWRGWIAAAQGRRGAAEQAFQASPAPGWKEWLAGKRLFEGRGYGEAADAFQRALDAWAAAEKDRARIPGGLNPPGDPAAARIGLAESLIAAGRARAAIAALETAVRQTPVLPWAYFLRGRAREDAGAPELAMSDYNLAARAALAAVEEASGEARFYRGVWLHRRGEFGGAETEFAQALNTGVHGRPAEADVEAWRALTAVAGGACGATRERLAAALNSASPFFPSAEARSRIANCAPRADAPSQTR